MKKFPGFRSRSLYKKIIPPLFEQAVAALKTNGNNFVNEPEAFAIRFGGIIFFLPDAKILLAILERMYYTIQAPMPV